MNRRGFLSLLGLSPAMYAVDRKSLWASVKAWFRPETTIRPGYWMTAEEMRLQNQVALGMLRNNLRIVGYLNHDYEGEFDRGFPVGDTITVKYPQRFEVRES